jgi:murein L,D-transpeptidase YcbB/YkuD
VQRALVAAGVELHGRPDGTFGLATTQALLAFQHQHGLDMSGVVDQTTAIALGLRQRRRRGANDHRRRRMPPRRASTSGGSTEAAETAAA